MVPKPRAVPLLSTRIKPSEDNVWVAEVFVNGTLARDVTVRINGKPIPTVPGSENDQR